MKFTTLFRASLLNLLFATGGIRALAFPPSREQANYDRDHVISSESNGAQLVINQSGQGVQPIPLDMDDRLFAPDHGSDPQPFWPVAKTNQTIYAYLSQQERYTKLVRLIDWEESYIAVLNSTTANITFFAPDNKALTPPRKKKPDHGGSVSLAQAYADYERLMAANANGDDDKDKNKVLKKIIHALLEYHTLPVDYPRPTLYRQATYATALEAKDGSFDGQARRVAITNDLASRLFINFYVTVEWVTINAANGFLYGINRPLFPPPSIMDELFFIDDFSILTSALQKVDLDSKLQWRTKWTAPDESGSSLSETEGDGPVVSLFAPNNWAWKHLPKKLRLYLFSPAGEKALKKLLQFHIVPEYILHSDWVHNATSDEIATIQRHTLLEYDESISEGFSKPFNFDRFPSGPFKLLKKMTKGWNKAQRASEDKKEPHWMKRACPFMSDNTWPPIPPRPPKITVNITVPTLLKDHPIHFFVAKTDVEHHLVPHTKVVVDGKGAMPPFSRGIVLANGVRVLVEGVARNGAVHAIPQVLHPFKSGDHGSPGDHDGHDDRWDDWEDWLPAWGDV